MGALGSGPAREGGVELHTVCAILCTVFLSASAVAVSLLVGVGVLDVTAVGSP